MLEDLRWQQNHDWHAYLSYLQSCGCKRLRAFIRSELPAFVRSNLDDYPHFLLNALGYMILCARRICASVCIYSALYIQS